LLEIGHGKGRVMRNHIHESSIVRWGLWGLMLVALAASGAPAQAATLRWKFKSGEALHYTMTQTTVTMAKLPGVDTKSTLTQTIEMTWAVKSVDSDGGAELTQTITRIRDQVEGTVGSYTYDSKDGKEPDSLIATAKVPVFKAMLGAVVPFKISPRGELLEVRVPDSLVKAVGELGPGAAGAGALFSEAGLKEMIGRASLVFPEGDVAEGKTWTQQAKSLSPAGTFLLDSTYRNDGPAQGAGPDALKISLTVKAAIAAADADGNPGANGLKIRSQKTQGTYTFDKAAGHILDSSLSESIEVSASVKVGLGATAKEMEIVQTSESTTIRKLVKGE
jgi:hypothetical protein